MSLGKKISLVFNKLADCNKFDWNVVSRPFLALEVSNVTPYSMCLLLKTDFEWIVCQTDGACSFTLSLSLAQFVPLLLFVSNEFAYMIHACDLTIVRHYKNVIDVFGI